MVIWLATPGGVGKAADPMLPVDALSAALSVTDVWVEYNNQWLLYSTPFERAEKVNKKMRYICLVGMTEDLMVRTIGRVDNSKLSAFLQKIRDLNKSAKTMHVTTPSGTDVKFEIEPKHYFTCDDGDASVPGIHMLSGQLNVVPRFDTVNGIIVFDGSLTPPFELLKEPITLTVENSIITKIEGGQEAVQFEKWLRNFDDPNMFRMAHIAYGFNPGAKLTGNIVEDERVWGCTEWGIGYVSPMDAPPEGINAKSHTDGICLNSSVWLDDRQILSDGVICDDELNELLE